MVPFAMRHQQKEAEESSTSLYSNPDEHDTDEFALFKHVSDEVAATLKNSHKDEVCGKRFTLFYWANPKLVRLFV